MTNESLDNISQKEEPVGDERAPLLSTSQDEEVRYSRFHGAFFHGSVFNLVCTIVGSGIMSLPATLKVLGLVLGEALSYGDLIGDAFGRIGKILLQVCDIINDIGVLIVGCAFGIHFQWGSSFWCSTRVVGEHWWTGRAYVLIVLTVAIFVPLICFKCIDSLRFSSVISFSLAVLFLIVVIGVTIYKLIVGSIETPTLFPSVTDLASFCDLFTTVPVVVFAYVCHYNVHTIENELEDSPQMIGVVQTSLALCTTVYVMTGLFGFLLSGKTVNGYAGTLDGVAKFVYSGGDPHGFATRKDKVISICMIILAVFSNAIAIYSDAYALLT